MRLRERYRRKSDYVVCPRCGLKSLVTADCCPDCGLVFSRLKIATNKDAKKKILRGDRDFIIRTSNLPSDVHRLKLILLTVFLGLLGAHCFYVGRYLRGSIILLNTLAQIMYVVFNSELVALDGGQTITALATISGIIMFIWAYDLVAVFIKKFKVPVAIDLNAETAQVDVDVVEDKVEVLGEERTADVIESEKKEEENK